MTNLKLKLRDELSVKLCKPENLCNVPDELGLRPLFKKLIL